MEILKINWATYEDIFEKEFKLVKDSLDLTKINEGNQDKNRKILIDNMNEIKKQLTLRYS